MANTVTNTVLSEGKGSIVQYITIASDGTDETDLVIYDSSARASSIGIPDPLTCNIRKIKVITNDTAATFTGKLEFDADTDVLALSIPPNEGVEQCFKDIGGLKNTAGTGITGDITLTTTNIASGDSLSIMLEVRPD